MPGRRPTRIVAAGIADAASSVRRATKPDGTGRPGTRLAGGEQRRARPVRVRGPDRTLGVVVVLDDEGQLQAVGRPRGGVLARDISSDLVRSDPSGRMREMAQRPSVGHAWPAVGDPRLAVEAAIGVGHRVRRQELGVVDPGPGVAGRRGGGWTGRTGAGHHACRRAHAGVSRVASFAAVTAASSSEDLDGRRRREPRSRHLRATDAPVRQAAGDKHPPIGEPVALGGQARVNWVRSRGAHPAARSKMRVR